MRPYRDSIDLRMKEMDRPLGDIILRVPIR